MADKVTETLLDALRQALAGPAEQRLFRSGKLAGLFTGRTGIHAEAATRALRDGVLEVVRTETKGKTQVEWVRLTPRGIEFLHDQESPVRALEELRDALKTTREGVPAWLGEMRQQLQGLETRLAEEVERQARRLDALTRRVEETLRRLADAVPPVPDGVAAEVPWALEALAYLDHRKGAHAVGECPLPELFAVLAVQRSDLSVTAFHDGLRRLQQRHVVRLLPYVAPPEELPQPEYALPDGALLLYYVAR